MRRFLSFAVLAAVLVAAGCGSSSKGSSSTTVSAAAPATTISATPPATAAGAAAPAATGIAVTTKSTRYGTVLAAGPKKLTVYLFEADNGARSACTGACAQAWPPVTTAGAPRTAGMAMQSSLSTITRADGTKQVTYRGHPLYFYADDKDAGDVYGQGSKAFGAGWYVLSPSGEKIDES